MFHIIFHNLPFFLQLIERFNWRLPGYIGKGHDISSFCHVDDVVNGHIAALRKGKLGERYLLTGENASFVQVFDLAATITKTSKPLFHIPLGLIEIYGWILVFFSRITGTLPLVSYPVCLVWTLLFFNLQGSVQNSIPLFAWQYFSSDNQSTPEAFSYLL